MSIPEELIDAYAENMELSFCKFELMGKMLNVNLIKERIKKLSVSELYIYGGGYLGIQCYLSIFHLIKVLALIDRTGKLIIERNDIPVISFQKFQEVYNGQKIIITPIISYQEIKENLLVFVPENNILFLGEFLGGIL